MKQINIYIFLFLLMAGTGCNVKQETMRPKVSGSAGEVLVVAPEVVWNSPAGDTLRALFSQEVPYLPQPEPLFNVLHVTPGQFDKLFHTHRNILFMKTGKEYKKAQIAVSHDRWATPQMIIEITAPDIMAMAEAISQGGESLVKKLNDMERQRIIEYYKHYLATDIYKKINEKFHISLDIPKGYSLDLDTTNFVWIASETPRTSQGILIYTYPYTSDKIFNADSLIEIRDRLLKKYVAGPSKGSYMATERRIPPEFKAFEKNGQYYAELRGLWKLENGFMGGPFVSITTVDKSRGRVVTVEGFVYGPGEKKRELMRQMESILYTFRINPPGKK
jgi:hypothetical protein